MVADRQFWVAPPLFLPLGHAPGRTVAVITVALGYRATVVIVVSL